MQIAHSHLYKDNKDIVRIYRLIYGRKSIPHACNKSSGNYHTPTRDGKPVALTKM